jgi:hypothetical protein
VLRVNAGGPAYTDALGHLWSADTGYVQGSSFATAADISGTSDPTLYKTLRFNAGALTYQFAVANGDYMVNLKFAETYFSSAGQRVFDIALNGVTVKSRLDIVAAAGINTAYDLGYPLTVANTSITITFTGVTGVPVVSAIEIVPRVADFAVSTAAPLSQTVAPSGTANFVVNTFAINGFTGTIGFSLAGLPSGATAGFSPLTVPGAGSSTLTISTTSNTQGGTYPLTITAISGALTHTTAATLIVAATVPLALPIRVNAGGGAYTDSLGHSWLADTGYQSGSLFSTTANIAATSDQLLYRDLRYSTSGPVTYQFTVPNGSYVVNLKFAELYFTTSGQRVFDVVLNGATVSSRVDVFSAAGGINRAVDLGYQTTVSNGMVTITLAPVTGLPAINAIEILAATPEFSVPVTLGDLGVTASNSAAATLAATSLSGFNGTISFRVSGLPAGATAGFQPVSVTGSGSTTMTISTTINTATGSYPLTVTASSGALSHTTSLNLVVTAYGGLTLPIRVNAGGSAYTDTLGQAWLADTGYQSGSLFSVGSAITGTADPALYRDLRYGTGPLTYQFTVPNGSYTVKLKFAELYYTSVGQRVFDVALNGTTAFSHLDVFAAAGAAFKAIDLSVPVTVSNGSVSIVLTPVSGLPTLNALEITQASAFSPIRINAGGLAYTDSLSQSWSADTGFQQGAAYSTAAAISGTSDAALYRTLRFSANGPLTYQFTVPNGTYSVILKFAELYYTSSGQRVFDVAINGTTVSPHLDVVSVAGGANRALDLVYPTTVSGGQVTITLTPVTGLPIINAIELR